MPEVGRVLQFRLRTAGSRFTPAEAQRAAEEYLAQDWRTRSSDKSASALSDPEVLVSILGLLRNRRDTAPQEVAQEAIYIHTWLLEGSHEVGVFDERDYFLGETAFLAGVSFCRLGQRDQGIQWLETAECSFLNTVNPAPSLSAIAFAKLGLTFEGGGYHEVLQRLPTVTRTFERFGMRSETAKCILLEAMTRKVLGQIGTAIERLEPVREWSADEVGNSLKARVLSELGDLYQLNDKFGQALVTYQEALGLLDECETSQTRADLKMFVGEAYRQRGEYKVALEAFQAARSDYDALGLITRSAYMRLLLADTLLRLSQPRHAEWEILAALPTIEERKMVPEGFAAVALLKESIRQRKVDPNALSELREHLQSSR